MTRTKSLFVFAVLLIVTYGVGTLASLFSTPALTGWYASLTKPPLTPPDWLISLVWSILYAVIAEAAWRTVRAAGGVRAARRELVAYGVQLLLGFSWSLIFFGLRNPGAALIGIIMLELAILATMSEFWRRSRVAGMMMIPYALWVLFTAYLNAAIWLLNAPAY